jgi:hypothetical protein
MKYFWGQPDASIKFCEDKYVHNKYVAEYYNSLSAGVYFLVGCFFYNTRLKHIANDLFVLSIGTLLFHMTMRAWGQMMDEAAMILLSFDVISDVTKIKRIYVLPILGFYFYFHQYFTIFLIIFVFMQIYLTKLGLEKTNPIQKRYLYLYILSFAIGLFFWLGDLFLCDYTKALNFHMQWHIFSSLGITFGLLSIL